MSKLATMAAIFDTRRWREDRQADRVEVSPSGDAMCRRCQRNIEHGSLRVAQDKWQEAYDGWMYVYYHAECVDEDLQRELHFTDNRSLEEERRHLLESTSVFTPQEREQILEERKDLLDALNETRLLLGRKVNWKTPQTLKNVCTDQSLADMVVEMPRGEAEMKKIGGIKKDKFEMYGQAFLDVIGAFRQYYCPTDGIRVSPVNIDYPKIVQAQIERGKAAGHAMWYH